MLRALILLILFIPAAGKAQDTTMVRFLCLAQKLYTMDTMQEGAVTEAVFRFEVCDTAPVVIHQVWPGCGCTVAAYPKDTLYPGKPYLISLQYFSEGRPGYFLRSAHVLYHSINPLEASPYAEAQLSITGFVIPKPQTVIPEAPRRQRKKSK